jgi:hypothetical protein
MRTAWNTIIGIDQYESIIVAEDSFQHRDGYHGFTGASFVLVNREEYERRTSTDELAEKYADVYTEMIRDGQLSDTSLNDFAKQQFAMYGDEAVFDMSFCELEDSIREHFGLSEEEYPVIECIGCGRMFHDFVFTDMRYVNPDAEECIKAIYNFEHLWGKVAFPVMSTRLVPAPAPTG